LLSEARKNFEPPPEVAGEEDVTFARYMKDWLMMVKPNIELTTYSSYSHGINVVISPYFEQQRVLLRKIQPKHIQDFYTYCMNVRGVSLVANT